MTISTYAELQTAITNWLGGRTDLTAYYPDWITLFEAYAARKLLVRNMEVEVTLTPSSGVATLPTDYLGYRRVTWAGSPRTELQYVHPSYFTAAFPAQPTGTPSVFTIEGDSLKVMPSSDTGLSFLYYAKNVTVSSFLNWLFTNHPDVYLFGALLEGANFTADTDQAIIWKSRRDEIMDEISKLNLREPGGLTIRNLNVTP